MIKTEFESFKDPRDGIVYKIVRIGNQVWMSENLRAKQYQNGDPIQNVQKEEEWGNTSTGAWCHYDNDIGLESIYGLLYNWNAVSDPRGLAPEGWHIPSDIDWKELELQLGINKKEIDLKGWRGDKHGYKLKVTGSTHWHEPNNGATNETGFYALPGGYRDVEGFFYAIGNGGYWWSSTEHQKYFAWYRSLFYTSGKIHRITSYEGDGFSVRCIKNLD